MNDLTSSCLDSGKPFVILGDGHVVFDVPLGATLPVDVQQCHAGRVVLHQSHLRRHGHDSRHGEVQEPFRRLFVLV